MGSLEGSRALVTGGGSGIGLATVRRLAKEGVRIVVIDRDEQTGRAAAEEADGTFLAADVSDSAEVTRAFGEAAAALGGLDIAHLNAGVVTGEADIARVTDEQYRRIMGVNVDHVFFGTREAVRIMEPAGGGTIVVTASLASLVAYPVDPIYAATKHAVLGLIRGVALTVEERGIRINAVCPGIVETPLVGDEAAGRLKDAGFPLLKAEDIAEAVHRAVTEGGTGQAWVCQPGREPLVYEFRGVPGPRVPGAEGKTPPIFR